VQATEREAEEGNINVSDPDHIERSSILEFERIEKECMNQNSQVDEDISRDIILPVSMIKRDEQQPLVLS
jgi:hypothetical protein